MFYPGAVLYFKKNVPQSELRRCCFPSVNKNNLKQLAFARIDYAAPIIELEVGLTYD